MDDGGPSQSNASKRFACQLVRLIALLVVVSTLIVAVGCDNNNPEAPTAPPITTTALAISGPDTLLAGTAARYSATATLSDGASIAATPAWSTDDPSIATVDNTGRLEGRRHGSTRVIATYNGRTDSRMIAIVANYSGMWTGSVLVRACKDAGELVDYDGGWCRSGIGRVGMVWSHVTMTLRQNGTNLSEVTGTYGSFVEPITGMVTADGRLTIAGTFVERDWEQPEWIIGAWRIYAWDSTATDPDAMSGHFSEHLDSLYPRHGYADMELAIVSMTRAVTSPSAIPQK